METAKNVLFVVATAIALVVVAAACLVLTPIAVLLSPWLLKDEMDTADRPGVRTRTI